MQIKGLQVGSEKANLLKKSQPAGKKANLLEKGNL